ncbi:SanA/YdcF family protein [Thioflexithrix psekupsensis]|nr:ElyC/SanA/YdcF family protein [Thioflexithrix psekupsensis]
MIVRYYQQWQMMRQRSLARCQAGFIVFWRWGMRLFALMTFLIILSLLLVIAAYVWIEYAHEDRIYSSVETVPVRSVGLLLGTSKWVANGRINLYFLYRIEAAVTLYQAGKIQHIIASGDNRRRNYNEPLDMLEALMARGVPRHAITLDYAGFRTLDSIVRAEAVFSQADFMIISQDFHNRRALFISQFYGLNAIAFNAQGVTHQIHFKTLLREYLARVKAVLDLYVLDTQPRFFGDKIPIDLDQEDKIL